MFKSFHDQILDLDLPPPKNHGRFHILTPEKKIISVDNMICSAGAESLLKMMFRGTTADVSVGGNFYIGICGSAAAFADTLASISTEPTVTNGYARIALTRDATGFPTIATVNGIWRALSKSITFTASGGAFSQNLVRIFLSNVASGTSGILYAYSGALINAITIADGQSYQITYEFYLN